MEGYTPTGQSLAELFLILDELIARIEEAEKSIGKAAGLTRLEWQVLGAIHPGCPGSGRRTVPQIARAKSLRRQTVATVINSFVERSLVELVPNPDHKRSRICEVTEFGIFVGEIAMSRHGYLMNRCSQAFKLDDLNLTRDVFKRILDQCRIQLNGTHSGEDRSALTLDRIRQFYLRSRSI